MSKKPTRDEKREAARQARKEAARKRRRAKRRKQIITSVLAIVVVAGIGGFFALRAVQGQADVAQARKDAGCSGVKELEQLEAKHIKQGEEHVPYNSVPPTSGPHYPITADWGTFADRVENELLVHNLEHGGVVIHYKDLNEDQIVEMEEFVDGYSEGVILNPNSEIETPIAIAAWGKLATCTKPADTKAVITVARTFIDKYCAKGPERVPLAC